MHFALRSLRLHRRASYRGTASAVPISRSNNAASAAEALWLAVESIDSPGNLGTIIRTAEAAGVAGIFLLGDDDRFDPAAVRASMGSLFSQTLVKCSTRDFIDWAKRSGVTIAASSPSGLIDYRALPIRRLALMLGSEKRGLSDHLIQAAHFTVRIPMRGRCDSINVAVAAGILLFGLAGQLPRTR